MDPKTLATIKALIDQLEGIQLARVVTFARLLALEAPNCDHIYREKATINWSAVAHRLRLVRLALDLTEEQAAADLCVTVRTYRKWEGGACQSLNHRDIHAFMVKHKVSYDWLFDGDPARVGKHLQRGKVAIL